MSNDFKLIIQALGIAIKKKQRHLDYLNSKLPLADSDHKQRMICQSIENTYGKIKEFETLKQKLK
jgi:hypothetical protein